MFGRTGGFWGWPIQWNNPKCCGTTLVAAAMKFGPGMEIQSPTGLSLIFLLGILGISDVILVSQLMVMDC